MALVEEALSYEILNAAFKVHNQLGPGFSEVLYKKAMVIELTARGHKVDEEKQILVSYRCEQIGEYFLDIVVDAKVIPELKAVSEILPIHKQQALSYLRASGLPLAMAINFGAEGVTHSRVANTRQNVRLKVTNQRNPLYREIRDKGVWVLCKSGEWMLKNKP